MLEFLSNTIGLEYPYEKYAQAVVPQYQWGGMEHVTATTLEDRTVHSPAEDAEFSSESLVAHELAHQWFGDLLTCRSWVPHLAERGLRDLLLRPAPKEDAAGEDASLRLQMATNFRNYLDSDKPAIAGRSSRPGTRTRSPASSTASPTPKGSCVLHALRGLLGDDAWLAGIRRYVK